MPHLLGILGAAAVACISFKSMPAQNADPLPVRTTARTRRSRRKSSSACINSATSRVRALALFRPIQNDGAGVFVNVNFDKPVPLLIRFGNSTMRSADTATG